MRPDILKMGKIIGIFFTFLLLTGSLPAWAVVLDWHQVEGARIRLNFDPTPAKKRDTFSIGLIEVELEDGWKTYWKNPGPSGMAPKLTISDQLDDQVWGIRFPAPSLIRDETGDGWSFGYKSRVALPFYFRLPRQEGIREKEVSGSLHIGICKEICIPVLIDFRFPVNSKPDSIVADRFDEAAQDALWHWADDQFGVVSAEEQERHVLLQLKRPAREKTPQLFAYTEGAELGLPEVVGETGNVLTYAVPVLSGSLSAGAEIEYIAVGRSRAINGRIGLP